MLAWLAAATVGLFFLRRLTAITQRYLETGAGSRMVYALAADCLAYLQRRSMLLHYQANTGDLIRRVTSDTGCARELVMRVFLPSLQALLTLIGMFVIMWPMNRGVAIFALLLSIPLLLIIRIVAKPLSEQRYREQKLQGQIYSLAEQTLSAIPLVQSFGRERHHNKHFYDLSRRTIGANLRYELTGHQFKTSTAAVTSIATACVMVYGGFAVQDGQLSVGSLLVLLAYFAALYSPLETLAYLSEGFASAAAGARRVFEVLDERIAPLCDKVDAKPLVRRSDRIGASIRYDNVVFGYEPNRPILNGISFEIAPGETVAVVGQTGAGKSTLLSLLLRFFDPWHGAIYVDGIDLREITLDSLRGNIAYMPQKPFLLPLSIADNVAYGRPNASRNEVVAAASAAKADDFIRKLPRGYDTVIGDRGATLSAGQKQRLSLARALIMDAPILVLDEPTAALDSKTESKVFEDIAQLFNGRTTFIVTHRFSTIQRATTAIVIEDGKVAELGTPRELLAVGGRYHQLHQMQIGHLQTESTEHSCASR
jgi:ATP-binding cassette subfamily B protein/subfamily B ATP-binding cassette protein MsbA